MNIVLLSGGSGKRLWPLSNDVRSKQFIKIFDNHQGSLESMVQRMYRGIQQMAAGSSVTIATSKSQVSELKNQLGDDISISIEPCRKDTFPAIVLAVSYLYDVKKLSNDDSVVICPVDPYVEGDYFQALKELFTIAEQGNCNIALMGIEPTYPSEKYGYIIPKDKTVISGVSSFKEKPTVDVAKGYIARGALWNAGVFAFKIGYLLKKAHAMIAFKNYQDLFEKYETIEKISFDFALVEKEPSKKVLRFNGRWADLGTWNTLTESMDGQNIGNAMIGERSEGCHVVNSLDIPILCIGAKDMIVAASPEGILVTDKPGSSKIKPYVEKIESPIMFAEKSWGEYRVIDISPDSLTIKVTLKAGHHMAYHSHKKRDETWTIVSGAGVAIVDDKKINVVSGSFLSLPTNIKHTIISITDLELIEVQIGKDIEASDKVKYYYPF